MLLHNPAPGRELKIFVPTAPSSAFSKIPSWAIQPGMTLEAVEKQYIALTLADDGGNKKQAALQVGISRRALYNKLQKYSLS